jgi:hypothetical protein
VSTDGGLSFSYPVPAFPISGWMTANGGIGTYSMPAADADITGGPFDGNLYVSYTNTGPEDNGRSDVDFRMSTDNGETWSERIQINDAPSSHLMDAFHPWLVVNEEGVIMVLFYDQRFDPPAYYRFDAFAAYSFDGGLTFTANHRISEVSSSPGALASVKAGEVDPQVTADPDDVRRPIQPRAGLIGEYIGLTAHYDQVLAVWTDSRHGNSEVYTANWGLPLLEPRLTAPENELYTANDLPSFHWATSWKHNQDRYRIEISLSETFDDVAQVMVVDTNFAIVGTPLEDGSYYWRVKAFNQITTDSSEYSLVRWFEVDTKAPDSPELVSPADGAVISNPTPTFTWNEVTKGAPVTYTLTIEWPGTTWEFPDLAGTDYTLTEGLPDGQLVAWSVMATDAASNVGQSTSRSLTYLSFICGDVDNDGQGPNISDLVYLVTYMFQGGPPPAVMTSADIDGSGSGPNIADLVYLVTYMFQSGPVPQCP